MKTAIYTDATLVDTSIEFGFLVKHVDNQTGKTWYTVLARPAYTNLNHEPRLRGWCGTTNDKSTYALGLARVIASYKNGRVRLAWVRPTRERLAALGYGNLDV